MSTPIGYIQSRGRARKENSNFIIMTEENNYNHSGLLVKCRELEAGMQQFCQTLDVDRNVALMFANDNGSDIYDRPYDPAEDNDEMYMEDAYEVKSTQAMVTKQSAVPLLHRYCGSLPSDRFTALQPSFEIASTNEGYTCTVRLPSNAAVREVTSKVCRTKIQAKKVAAVNCCKQLHLKKALTDHLLPINYKREILGNMEAVLDENGMVVGSRRRKAMYEKRIPSFWKRPVPRDWAEEKVGEATGQDVETDMDLMKGRVASSKKDLGLLGVDPSCLMDIDSADIISTDSAGTKVIEDDLPLGTTQDDTKVDAMEIEEIPLEDTDGPFDLWVSTIEFNVNQGTVDGIQIRRLCMMTWKQFPQLSDLELNLRGNPFTVQIRPFATPISVDKKALLMLKEFNIVMSSVITNKEFSCLLGDFPYFLAPLVMSVDGNGDLLAAAPPTTVYDQFDWPVMQQAIDQALVPLDLDNLDGDTVIVDFANRSQRYFVNRICHDLTPASPIVQSDALREVGYDSLADYYQQVLKVAVTKWDEPVINVRKISKVMNFLSPTVSMEPTIRKSTAAYVIPEFCSKYFVCASVFQTWMIIPSVMSRLDAFLSAFDARKRFGLAISDELMLEAYTTPSANMKMDYERLETLGGKSYVKHLL